MLADDDVVAWTGPQSSAPAADARIDVGGRAVVPGFVDSHPHLVFAGDRAAGFDARISGAGYDGGGIADTVAATRSASADALRAGTAPPRGRDARPGHHDGGGQERLRVDGRGLWAATAGGAAALRRPDVGHLGAGCAGGPRRPRCAVLPASGVPPGVPVVPTLELSDSGNRNGSRDS